MIKRKAVNSKIFFRIIPSNMKKLSVCDYTNFFGLIIYLNFQDDDDDDDDDDEEDDEDDDDDEEESSKITETEAATPSKKAKEPELKEASGKRTKGLPVKGNVGENILFASMYIR